MSQKNKSNVNPEPPVEASVESPEQQLGSNAAPAEAEHEQLEVVETPEAIAREARRDTPIREKRKESGPVGMACSLLIICAVVALIVSFVNAVTADVIAENDAREKREAIGRIFGENAVITELSPLEGTNAVYAIQNGEGGYCVSLYAGGFGGNIDMMVGVNADGALRGVEIVSLSETPGLGSRVNDAAYLAQYIGQSGTLRLRENIEAISGATISSRAVLSGVNAAASALREAGLIGGAGK